MPFECGHRNSFKKNTFYPIESQNTISKAKYSDLIDKIERMSKFFHFILTKLTVVGVVAPDLLITIGNYFIYDLGEQSYYLSAPMMYVSE